MTDFPSDARVKADVVPSPNHGERRHGQPADMLVLHYTGMPDERDALRRLCSPASGVSAHYVVFTDGTVTQCVPEARRAWHAGEAFWKGVTDVNSHAIGIEIANPGHEHGYVEFPPAQIESVIALAGDIASRRKIAPDMVVAHSDVAPLRKEDPGEKFPWRLLAAAGIGLWVTPAPLDLAGAALPAGDAGKDIESMQAALADYGYGLAVNGRYDDLTAAVVRAFQRHFRPARVDGIADVSTCDTLSRLLTARHRV